MFLLTLALTLGNRVSIGVSSRRSLYDAPCRPSMTPEASLLAPMARGGAWDPENGVLWPCGTKFAAGGKPKGEKEDSAEKNVEHSCNATGDAYRPCLRKCCPLYQAMDCSTLGCVPHHVAENEPWFNPPVMDDAQRNSSGQESAGDLSMQFLVFHDAEDECEKRILPEEEEFFVSSNDGSLITQSGTKMKEAGSFCVDYLIGWNKYIPFLCYQREKSTTKLVIPTEGGSSRVKAVTAAACPTVEEPVIPCRLIVANVHLIAIIICVVFLSLSLFVHAFIRELRSLPGKCLMCHMFSLLTGYVFLVIRHVFGIYPYLLDHYFCLASKFIVFFLFISAFFWLRFLSIDLLKTFRSMRFMAGQLQERDRKMFVTCAAYSWIIPLFMVLFTFVIEFGLDPDYLFNLTYREKCWYTSENILGAMLAVLVGATLACNIVVFAVTALKIHKLKRVSELLEGGESGRHQQEGEDNKRFRLHLNLFFVLGVNWVLLIFSGIVGEGCVWIVTDLLNTMLGFSVFYNFAWKVRCKVAEKLCRLAAQLYRAIVHPYQDTSPATRKDSIGSSNTVHSRAENGKFILETVSSRVPMAIQTVEVTMVN